MAEQETPDLAWAEFMRELARNLHWIRVERGYSQDQVAYTSGLSRSSYQRLERGRVSSGAANNPTLRNLIGVAQTLDVSLDELVPQAWPEVQVGKPVQSKRRRSSTETSQADRSEPTRRHHQSS